jgi:hypothetical protein
MSSGANNKATYHGRILNGDFSPELKEKLKKRSLFFMSLTRQDRLPFPIFLPGRETKRISGMNS